MQIKGLVLVWLITRTQYILANYNKQNKIIIKPVLYMFIIIKNINYSKTYDESRVTKFLL